MSQNPYMINVADFSQGMQGLMAGVEKKAQFEQKKAAETKNLQMREEAYRLMQEGTPEEVGEYVAKNPGAAQVFEEVIGITNKVTKDHKAQTSWDILRGTDEEIPGKLLEHGEVIDQQGGDATETIGAVKQSSKDPDKIREGAKKYLMSIGDPKIKAFIEDERKQKEAELKEKEFGLKEKKLEQEGKTPSIKEFEYAQKNKEYTKYLQNKEAAGKEELLSEFTSDQLDELAWTYSQTGETPFKGRSESVRKANVRLKRMAMEQQKARGVTEVQAEYDRLDRKGMTKSIDKQVGKLGSMRSFIRNIDKQSVKIAEVGKRMKRLDTKILNVPINKMMEAIGDADRAVFKLMIGELEEEIGKLASGATESVAALTDAGREKWRNIFDPNLSYEAMMQLVKESKEVGHMRVDSMKEALKESRQIRAGSSRQKKASTDPFQEIDITPFKQYPVGKEFNTPYGKARWDGTKLIKVEG